MEWVDLPGAKEDRRLVTDKGRYTADTTFPDQAYLVVYRSRVQELIGLRESR